MIVAIILVALLSAMDDAHGGDILKGWTARPCYVWYEKKAAHFDQTFKDYKNGEEYAEEMVGLGLGEYWPRSMMVEVDMSTPSNGRYVRVRRADTGYWVWIDGKNLDLRMRCE
jgi:hypothetical protein